MSGHGHVLPEVEAETLRRLRDAAHRAKPDSPERDDAWRKAVRQVSMRYEPLLTGLPGVSSPPVRERPRRTCWWAPPLPDGIRRQLEHLRRESEGLRGQVRGTTREHSPEGRASAEFAAIVHHLITEQGYTAYRIGLDLGVTTRAIDSRLEMWGYQPYPPSQRPVYLREKAS